MNKNIFKLTHEYAEGETIIIETEMCKEELKHLIKIWQTKTFYIFDTFDLFPKEMYEILQYCDCRKHELLKGEKVVEIDLYEVWEDSSIKTSNDDLVCYVHITENATREFLKILLDELS